MIEISLGNRDGGWATALMKVVVSQAFLFPEHPEFCSKAEMKRTETCSERKIVVSSQLERERGNDL